MNSNDINEKSNKYGKWCVMGLVSFVAFFLWTGDVYAATDDIIPNDETYDEDYNQEYVKTNTTWLSTEPFVKSYEWIWALIIVALGAGMIVVIVKKERSNE